MKRALIVVLLVAAGFGGGVLWIKQRGHMPPAGEAPAAADKPEDKEPGAAQLSRDTNGNAVVTLSEQTQQNLGIQTKSPSPLQMSPELKGYGKVLDPAPLAGLMTELASAQAAATASSNELARLQTLEGQGNASARVMQAAEAAARRDLVAVQSARERLLLSWGKAVADQQDLPAFVHSLTSLESVLVRIDLPVGEALSGSLTRARIATLSGRSFEAEFLELAPSVDPQVQGQGFVFLLKPNSLRLTPGESVAGYLKIPEASLAGVVIPREALVRTEGAGWVYVRNPAGNAYTRVQVALDRPTETGWFVTNGVTASDQVIVTGAQQLLSFELKGAGGEE